jgi:hypothetical protein
VHLEGKAKFMGGSGAVPDEIVPEHREAVETAGREP